MERMGRKTNGNSNKGRISMSTDTELCLDVSAEHARALHRVVRAMHDGHCPSCGYLGPAECFWADEKPHPTLPQDEGRHECPVCHFIITETEARGALRAFKPHLKKSLDIFEKWRAGESLSAARNRDGG